MFRFLINLCAQTSKMFLLLLPKKPPLKKWNHELYNGFDQKEEEEEEEEKKTRSIFH